jgi:hypothetical protein
MIRRLVPLATIFALTLAGPLRAEEPNDANARLARALEKLEQRLGVMDAKLDTVVDMGKDMKQLREDVNKLQREVADLRRPSNGTTSSYYGGPPSSTSLSPAIAPPVAPPLAMGTVRLVNNYLTDMTANVNGLVVTVPAGQVQDVRVPPGALTYQVYQVQPSARVSSIAPNEMLTLRLFPM